MPRRFPLYAKILLLFFLNLGLLACMFWIVFRAQFRTGPDWFLPSDASERIDSLCAIVRDELNQESPAKWSATLDRFADDYHHKVRFLAFDGRGGQMAGETMDLPAEIRQRLNGPPHPPPQRREHDAEPPDAVNDQRPFGPPPEPRPKFMSHTTNPSRYWVIVREQFNPPDQRHPVPLFLVLVSDTLGAGGLFFETGPWISIGLAAVALSALLWFPLVRGINRSIAQLTHATQQIAEGRFEARVPEDRRDELGDLGKAVNRMAGRLAGLVAGQKRFLGDVAHELCSPLAKLRVSIGILDQRANAGQKEYVDRAEEEAAHIANLVNELLSFSKASLTAPAAQMQTVQVREIVEKAVRREAPELAQVKVSVLDNVTAKADPELLTRALSNLLRNAVRYAGAAGPITISAHRDSDEVAITVADCGPGVPAKDLSRIFDPFYRTDASRDRETGGVGLGLAIVKTCVESCGGRVSCRNLEPGFEVAIRLPGAEMQI